MLLLLGAAISLFVMALCLFFLHRTNQHANAINSAEPTLISTKLKREPLHKQHARAQAETHINLLRLTGLCSFAAAILMGTIYLWLTTKAGLRVNLPSTPDIASTAWTNVPFERILTAFEIIKNTLSSAAIPILSAIFFFAVSYMAFRVASNLRNASVKLDIQDQAEKSLSDVFKADKENARAASFVGYATLAIATIQTIMVIIQTFIGFASATKVAFDEKAAARLAEAMKEYSHDHPDNIVTIDFVDEAFLEKFSKVLAEEYSKHAKQIYVPFRSVDDFLTVPVFFGNDQPQIDDPAPGQSILNEPIAGTTLRRFGKLLENCNSPEYPVRLQIYGFSSSAEYGQKTIAESQSLNLKLANRRAKAVADGLDILVSDENLQAGAVLITSHDWKSLQEMAQNRPFNDRPNGQNDDKELELFNRVALIEMLDIGNCSQLRRIDTRLLQP